MSCNHFCAFSILVVSMKPIQNVLIMEDVKMGFYSVFLFPRLGAGGFNILLRLGSSFFLLFQPIRTSPALGHLPWQAADSWVVEILSGSKCSKVLHDVFIILANRDALCCIKVIGIHGRHYKTQTTTLLRILLQKN